MGAGALKLFLVAGEPSGDRLGAALMAGLKRLCPEVEFLGLGGPLMAAEGLESLFDIEELAVMGLAEVLPKYRALKRRIAETAAAAVAAAPTALITIDSPDFCLRVARQVRARRPDLRVIHYVAPSVWAWRPGRAAKMARYVDHVLALLPFEPPYMEAAGMSCDFVGHPVVGEPVATAAQAQDFRAAHGIAAEAPVAVALPGSRRGEIERLAPRFCATLARVAADRRGLRVVVPSLPHLLPRMRALCADWPGAPVVVTTPEARRAAFAAGDAALAASGTVSLELAAAGLPMVIGYDMHRLSWVIINHLVKVDVVTLVSLVTETRHIPEFLGPRCDPALMAPALLDLMAPGPARSAQIAAMAQCMRALGRGAPDVSLLAARSVLRHLS